MYSQTNGAVAVSFDISLEVFRMFPCITDAVIARLVQSELVDPLHVDGRYSPQKICLTPERIKQAIKETSPRDQLRKLKDEGRLKDDQLLKMVGALHPLNEMMHFYWRQVEMVRTPDPTLSAVWHMLGNQPSIVADGNKKTVSLRIEYTILRETNSLAA